MTSHVEGVPQLPVTQIRAALEAHDWVHASDLLERHEQSIRDAWRRGPASCTHAAWRELMRAQHALHDELRGARELAGLALAQLRRQREGMLAYGAVS